jgi:hypothetical protein
MIGRTLTIAILLALAFNCAVGQTLPVDGDFRSHRYDYIDRLINQGYLDCLFENSKPYDFGEVAASIDELPKNMTDLDRRLLGLLNHSLDYIDDGENKPRYMIDLSSDGSFAEDSAARSYESVRGNIFWQPNQKITVLSSFTFDERLANDPNYSGKVWSGFAGRIDRAYMQFDLPYLKLTFGRDKAVWGPGRRGNLLLSDNSRSMDMLRLSGSWGPFRYTALTAVLDHYTARIVYPHAEMVMRVNRYLCAHRIEIKPFKQLSIGLSESVLYGGVGRQLEFYYMNPLTWYHGEQLNNQNEDNTFLSFDFTLRPKNGISLYGEFLVDDFQIEKKSKGDDEPNELGFIAGLYLTDPIRGSNIDISAEYTRVNNWTYNQGKYWNRYVNDGKIIGHFLGPDRSSLYFSVRKWMLWGCWALVSFERQEIGEGNVFDDWTEPWLFSAGTYEESFPTGVVETRDIFGFSLHVFHWNKLQIDLDNYYIDVKNSGNLAGESTSYYQGRLTVKGTIPIL